MAVYRQLAAKSRLAPERQYSLRETILFLQAHGQVVLVRLPTGPAMTALERQYAPGFDNTMSTLAKSLGVPYLNYLDQPYPTNDGNHLTRAAAAQLSQRLAGDLARLP
jgi:lysophospholipase L1-like esterase